MIHLSSDSLLYKPAMKVDTNLSESIQNFSTWIDPENLISQIAFVIRSSYPMKLQSEFSDQQLSFTFLPFLGDVWAVVMRNTAKNTF